MEEDNIEEEKKDIEIVTGDDSELDISNVYDHLNLDKVRETPDKQNIIIPGLKQEEKDEEQDEIVFEEDDDNN